MKDLKKWCEDIKNELINNANKRVVLIAGASSSGKSYSSQILSNYLNDNGIRASVLSADNYYKGLSKITVEKALLSNNNLNKYLNIKDQIVKTVRSVIEFYPFVEKFNKTNFNKLKENLKYLVQDDAQELANNIKYQYENINFDEPFALDFTKLTQDINNLINHNEIILPKYDFPTSEVTFNPNNKLSGDFDVYIVEGLYLLRDEVLKKLDNDKLVTALVDCDSKTLLSRKLNRDIKSGRSTLSPEQILTSYLSQVIPSYYKYIEPFNKKAKHILSSTLTKTEIDKKEGSTQLKFRLNDKQLDFLNQLYFDKDSLYLKQQTDYYFGDNSGNNNFVVRLREVDGLASKLTFKNTKNKGLFGRKIEEYDLKQFSKNNRDITAFLDNFIACGFNLDTIINKNREVFSYGNTKFKLDKVDGLGSFIEFDEFNKDTQELIDKLNLKDVCNISYLNLKKHTNKKISTEKEFKFLVDKIPTKYDEKMQIKQYYFDFKKHYEFLNKIFGLDLDKINSARVRKVTNNNNEEFYLTIKSAGMFEREEHETKIDKTTALYLLQDVTTSISKTRFVVNYDGLKYEFDRFDNGLNTAEVEVKKDCQYKKITTALKNHFKTKYKNITNDKNFKNINMSKNCTYHNLVL